MKIAWFTPFHLRSAIGEFSQHVTAELANFADVELWISREADVEPWTSGNAPLLATKLPIVHYSLGSEDLQTLDDYDMIIYNLGNYLDYHRDVHMTSLEYPGIVILHDRVLHHLFADMWLMGEEPNPPRYIERMGVYYGREGADIARASLEGKRSPVWEDDDEVIRYPLYEEGIVNALGVVTHSEQQARGIRESWLGPVSRLHLPCYRDVLNKTKRTSQPVAGRRLRLLTVGHVNPNKQVHKVIEMLANKPELAASVEYRVAGPDGGFVAYRDRLRRLIEGSKCELSVEMLGWLSDDELEREMEWADVFVNLRDPNIEGSSASLMKQLAFGRPVLCFDSGCFAELPKGSVARVPVGDFSAAAAMLEEMLHDSAIRSEFGEHAHEVAASSSESRYAEGLLDFIGACRGATPALRALDVVARELRAMHADTNLSIFDEIANDFGRILSL